MDAVQTLPPTAPPSGLKSAMSVLDQDIHDGLLQDSSPPTPAFEYPPNQTGLDGDQTSRGRARVPKPVHTQLSPVEEASPKSPTAVFADLQQQLKDELAKISRPSTPSNATKAHVPEPIRVASSKDIEDSQKSPTAIFERLGLFVHDELAQESGPGTPTEEMANPTALHLQNDIPQASAPPTPRDPTPSPPQPSRHSDRKPGSPINVAHFNSLASASFAQLDKQNPHSDSEPATSPESLDAAKVDEVGEVEAKRADSAQSPLLATFDALPRDLKQDIAQTSEPGSPATRPMEESEPLTSTFERLPASLREEIGRTASPVR